MLLQEILIDNEVEIADNILHDDTDSESEESHCYSVKIVNPSRMKEFHTVDLGMGKICQSIQSLRQFIKNNLLDIPGIDKPDIQNVEIGYVEPGHGMKGKKIWLFNNEDVKNMYDKYQSKPSIRLWCYSCVVPKKDSAKTGSKFESQGQVDEIYEELQVKHKGKYSPEQLRAWSHMIRLKTHDSHDEPPDKPFFNGRKRCINCPSRSTPEKKRLATSSGNSMSPGRKVNIRSELIDQLDKWHKLLDLGVPSQIEYDNLKEKILTDIKQL